MMARPRYSREAKEMLGHLVRLCDAFGAFCAAEDGNADTGVNFLLDCVTEIAPKVPAYSGLVAVLAAKGAHDLASKVIRDASRRLAAHLTNGEHPGARTMMRFLAACASYGVIDALSVLSIFEAAVNAAGKCAEQNQGRAHTLWQPYSDSLVRITLLALPFLAAHTWTGDLVARFDALVASAASYGALRAAQVDLRFCPTAHKLDGSPCEQDSGSYALTGETLAAVREIHEGRLWGEIQSVQLYTNELESVLESLARPEVDMATVDVPTAPPGVPEGANDAQTAAALVQHYGPRGAIRLLDTAVSQASSLRLEHLMFEDYVADIMDVWHDDRTECVKRLATLPVAPSQAATYAPMLAEAMFGQLLRLPTPRHRTVAYLGVMVDLCRLKTVPFSRSMSGCMRELFKLTGLLDPVLLERVAEYLAYHLAAFDFIWPWEKWGHVVQAPQRDAQKRFCTLVMWRMLCLSYWEKILDVVPSSMHSLLPPEPVLTPIAEESTPEEELDPWQRRAKEVLELLQKKQPVKAVEDFASASQVAQELGSKEVLAGALIRGLVEAGAKSLTHTVVMLERYIKAVKPLVESMGLPGEMACVAAAKEAWRKNNQRFAMVLDRMMGLRVVGAEAITRWCMSQPALTDLTDPVEHSSCWSTLFAALDRMVSRTADCVADAAEAADYKIKMMQFVEGAEAVLREAQAAKEAGEESFGGEPINEAVDNAQGRVGAAQKRLEDAEASIQDAEEATKEAREEEQRALLLAAKLIVERFGDPSDMPGEAGAVALNPKAVNQPEWAAAGKGAEPSDVAEGEPTYMIVEAHELLARVGEFSRRYMHSLGDKFETLDKEVAPVGSVHPRVRDRLLSVYIGM